MNIQIDETASAIEDLRAVLEFKRTLFGGRIHDGAMKRLETLDVDVDILILSSCPIPHESGPAPVASKSDVLVEEGMMEDVQLSEDNVCASLAILGNEM